MFRCGKLGLDKLLKVKLVLIPACHPGYQAIHQSTLHPAEWPTTHSIQTHQRKHRDNLFGNLIWLFIIFIHPRWYILEEHSIQGWDKPNLPVLLFLSPKIFYHGELLFFFLFWFIVNHFQGILSLFDGSSKWVFLCCHFKTIQVFILDVQRLIIFFVNLIPCSNDSAKKGWTAGQTDGRKDRQTNGQTAQFPLW